MRAKFLGNVLGIAALLSGCTTTQHTYMASGQPGFEISCSAWSSCMVKAGNLCRQRGYKMTYSDEVDGRIFVSCGESSPP